MSENGPSINLSLGKETLAVHAGDHRSNRGVVNPIEPSSSFYHVDESETTYPRYFNSPNQEFVVQKLCALENAAAGLIFSSGMAAISTTLLSLLEAGDHLVMQAGVYGGTRAFVNEEIQKRGIEVSFVETTTAPWESEIRKNTRLIYLETPNNPLLEIVDLQQISNVATPRKIITVADNTFASPINQNPIDHGVDLVLHSGTKYLGGHSDLTFGAVLGPDHLVERIRGKAEHFGGNTNALTCYLIERSLKTLAVRVDAHNHNAMVLADFLENHAAIRSIRFPGLASHPNHDVAAKQMSGFGGMLSFELANAESAARFLRELKIVAPALSLGGVESLASIPMFSSHSKISADERQACGIAPGLVRLSVGIENATDLVADLEQALKAIQ